MSALVLVKEFEGSEVRFGKLGARDACVAQDACRILGLTNVSMALRRLPDSEKGIIQIDTLGGPQKMWVVTRKGIDLLAMRSDKPEATRFQHWLADKSEDLREKGVAYASKVPTALDLFRASLEVAERHESTLRHHGQLHMLTDTRLTSVEGETQDMDLIKSERDAALNLMEKVAQHFAEGSYDVKIKYLTFIKAELKKKFLTYRADGTWKEIPRKYYVELMAYIRDWEPKGYRQNHLGRVEKNLKPTHEQLLSEWNKHKK